MQLILFLALKTGERRRGECHHPESKSRSGGWKRVLKTATAIARYLL